MTGLNHHAGRLEIIVNGRLVDTARILFNGVPEIRVSGSNILKNKIYKGDGIDGLKELARRVAFKRYSPGFYDRWVKRKPNPVIEINYAEA